MGSDRSDIDIPVPYSDDGPWGSDYLAETMRRLGFKHVALNPGSSFRGLHDSLVNHLGNTDPTMLLCLHEEHAVAIAHGWAKVTGEPMAVILHANVGLMHGAMAIYNAWCDRVPMVIFGATGPVDAAKRRPWIDWIHTSRDQAAMVRPFVKWDDQPASLEASIASVVRAHTVTRTAPRAPTYVCFDVSVQEEKIERDIALPDPALYQPPQPPEPSASQINALCNLLDKAETPVFLFGRMSRSPTDWALRVALAEKVGAKVLTDIKTGASFPTAHPDHVGPPSFFLSETQAQALAKADLIVAFDWVDPAGALKQAGATGTLVNITLDHQVSNGWSFDHMGQPAAAHHIASEPDAVVRGLATTYDLDPASCRRSSASQTPAQVPLGSPLTMDVFAQALNAGLDGEEISLVRLPLGWGGAGRDFHHPLDYLGYDGGAGIGSGPGMLVGAALALRDRGRIPVGVLGDGDTMMGISAFWTAARYGVPLITIVCNNRSYFNDEVHQERVARMRGRPVENKAIGQAISTPDLDFAAMARAQGLQAIGPVKTAGDLVSALREAVAGFKTGASVLIDAHVEPEYAKAMADGMTETADDDD